MAATADTDCTRAPDGRIPLREFTDLRDNCLALRQIFLPDEIWSQFVEWHAAPDEVAAHASVTLLAFRRGYLPRVTGPVHRYLMSPRAIRPDTSRQYLQDLRERWMFDADPIRRNRLSRIFRGRLIELQFASYLESKAHTIIGMEATRKGPDIEGPDIETISPNDQLSAFEVKFFGIEDGDFTLLMKSMGGYPESGSVSPYAR